MVVGATERIEKYRAKLDPTVVGTRFSAVKELAESKAVVRQTELAGIRDDIRQILNANDIAPLVSGIFQAFANRLYGLKGSGGSVGALEPIAHAEAQAWLSSIPSETKAKAVINAILVYFGFSPLP